MDNSRKKPATKGKSPSNMRNKLKGANISQKDGEAVLLSGGNPQIAKADGNAPVQAYIAAMPGWKPCLASIWIT